MPYTILGIFDVSFKSPVKTFSHKVDCIEFISMRKY